MNDLVKPKKKINNKLLLAALAILSGIVLVGFLVYKSNQKIIDTQKGLKNTEEVDNLSNNIHSLGKDVELASRNFIISNDSFYLLSINRAEKRISGLTMELRKLTKKSDVQQILIDSLEFYNRQQFNFSHALIKSSSTKGVTSALAQYSSIQGKLLTQHIDQVIKNIQQEEEVLLKKRKQFSLQSLNGHNQLLIVMFILMALFAILGLFITAHYLLQHKEKKKRAAELAVANEELIFQNKEKENRAKELTIANKELAFQNNEKEKRAAELIIANKELAFQNDEKEKRAAELTLANKELAFQNEEKENRAAELIIANHELAFQNEEKEKRAAELTIANIEMAFQNGEKEKRAEEKIATTIQIIKNEKRYQNMVERISDAFIALDLNGEFEHLNKNAEDLFKRPSGSLLGKNIWKEFPEFSGSAIHEAYHRSMKTKKNIHINEFQFTADIWVETNIYPSYTGISIYCRDITEQRKAEANLKTLEDEIHMQKIQDQKLIARSIIKAQEMERNHIGQELHDNVNQTLAAAKMYLGIAGNKDAEIKKIFKYPLELIDASIEDIRKLCSRLVTPIKNINLEIMVKELLESLKKSTETNTNFHYAVTSDSISAELKLNIYRTIQEQINNITKYADAKNVIISIKTKGKTISITVEDDGKGFLVKKKRKGIGISNMINRIESFNGKVDIKSSIGHGCKTQITIPY